MPDIKQVSHNLRVGINNSKYLSSLSIRILPSGWEHTEYINCINSNAHKSMGLPLKALVRTGFPAKPAKNTLKHTSVQCHPDHPSAPFACPAAYSYTFQ